MNSTKFSSSTNNDKYNCIIIRAQGTNKTSLTDIPSICSYLEPITLKSYGCEISEKHELISKYGMHDDLCETGKFYDHEDTSNWYYYVYGRSIQKKQTNEQIMNFIASRLLGHSVYDDIAIVRSGPITSKFEPWLSIEKLAQTVLYYETHDPQTIFAERERKRFFEKMGIQDQKHIPAFAFGFNF
ncbi:unnamed protein product [Rotaria sp. Silwood1]|nr:unnamed protein product [Rotaria sp. Silwood1]CAF3570038.1 unnamed protein product [Rotaria sp. Silwood1]CAF3590073.1 unnamed protein product [Rotaria sp. Silwood1]CAF4796768.1 unnamed protein product [Rotaria sp. Silwood1]CAF4918121.1 unnamed protein product [Rotaria sp. Silwood1]